MSDRESESREPGEVAIDDPEELVRIVTMLGRLNAELQDIDLDDPSVDRLVTLHRRAVASLDELLPEDLVAELHRYSPSLGEEEHSEGNVRMAHLQLVGWLEGLVQGIHMTAASKQLRAGVQQLQAGEPQTASTPASGTYL